MQCQKCGAESYYVMHIKLTDVSTDDAQIIVNDEWDTCLLCAQSLFFHTAEKFGPAAGSFGDNNY